MKKNDVLFFKILTVVEAISFIASVVLFIISIVNIITNQSLNNEFFELFYFGVHILIHFLALAFSFKAIKSESFIIKPLTHNRYAQSQRSNGATIICSIVLGLFTLILVYDTLILINVGVYDFNFTLTLKLVLIAVSVFMMISMTAFIVYPFIHKTK